MIQTNKFAYPYASAIFAVALNQDKLNYWKDLLKNLSIISSDYEFNKLVANPNITQKQIIDLFIKILELQDSYVINLISLLYINKRLNLLNDIYNTYKNLMDKHTNILSVVIESAYALNQLECNNLENLLANKFKKNIAIKVSVNPNLIGGIKILIDDKVIDLSILASIKNLACNLSN